ncbi:hypothetical protein SKAU_G00241390 [Synaphobranchus kaupii]|uniref:Uncharacterized protein n=1 Tax=Synaphobranchus kaupii TaxID=118154 RepID=A0A9Q1F7R9_SYNKA|nr:hypothetical protein SKAU_G00241390 [Synaphobranchus kaupii]
MTVIVPGSKLFQCAVTPAVKKELEHSGPHRARHNKEDSSTARLTRERRSKMEGAGGVVEVAFQTIQRAPDGEAMGELALAHELLATQWLRSSSPWRGGSAVFAQHHGTSARQGLSYTALPPEML